MGGFKLDTFDDRRTAAAKAEEALLEKFRAAKRAATPADATGAAPEAAPADASRAEAPPADSAPEATAEGNKGRSAARKARAR
jgi:hypothetical protein